jgi:signal transduction histidine kinase
MSRLEVGHEPLNRERVVVEALCLRLEGDVQPLVQPGVTLRWRIDLGHASIVTDEVKLRTILKNLVVNALKFTSTGFVEVSAETDEDVLVLSVRDTGIGIAEGQLEHVFDRFWRAPSVRGTAGSGLGLAITRWVVQAHQGTITVASTVGYGTTFVLILPVVQGPPRQSLRRQDAGAPVSAG